MVQFYWSGGSMTFSLEYFKAGKPAKGVLVLKTACEHVSVARLEEIQSLFRGCTQESCVAGRQNNNSGQKVLGKFSCPTSSSKQDQLWDWIRLLWSISRLALKTFSDREWNVSGQSVNWFISCSKLAFYLLLLFIYFLAFRLISHVSVFINGDRKLIYGF